MSRLMIIDDSELDNFIVEKLMDKYDLFTIRESYSAAIDAIVKIQKDSDNGYSLPDIILLDLRMPGMGGLEFLETLKSINTELKNVTAIYVVTTSLNPKDKKIAESYPFVKGYLPKPLTKEVLFKEFSAFKNMSLAS